MISVQARRRRSRSGLPSSAYATVTRIWFRSNEGDIVIEYEGPPPTVKAEKVTRGWRVTQTFPINSVAGDQTYGIRINDSGRRGSDDPIEESEKLVKAGRPFEAWQYLKTALPRVRDAQKKKDIGVKLKYFERLEREEWQDCQEKAFHALISKRHDKRKIAVDAIDSYQGRWTDTSQTAKAEALRQEVAKAIQGDPAGDRPDRILARAKKFSEGGKKALAAAMLEALQARYPSFEIPDEVKESINREPTEESGP